MLAPVFGARGVPALVKLGLAAAFSVVLYPLIAGTQPSIPVDILPYTGLVIKEILVGLVIGFVVYTINAILQGAGELIDFQIGFIMGNSIDPVYGMQSPMMGNFQMVLATMILLATNAHHYLVVAVVKSYQYIPLNPGPFPNSLGYYVMIAQNVFVLSAQIALPVFGALTLANIGVGFLAKTVPQLNIFAVIFPVKILFGFVLLILVIPFFGDAVTQLFNTTMEWLFKLFKGWGG